MCRCGALFNGKLGSARLTVRLGNLRGLSNINDFTIIGNMDCNSLNVLAPF